jgi:hypothetical protein
MYQHIHEVWQLMEKFNELHPKSYFFSRGTLRFFGERISEMRLFKRIHTIHTDNGEKDCYILSVKQRNAPEGVKQRVYKYFDAETLDLLRPIQEGYEANGEI